MEGVGEGKWSRGVLKENKGEVVRSRGTVGRLGLVKMGGAAELSTGGDGRARATGRASTSSHALRLNGATTQANGAGSHGFQAAAAGGAAAQEDPRR